MSNLSLTENYISFKHASDFRHLCRPLIRNTKIDEFYYVRLYSDGNYFNFNTFVEMDRFMLLDKKGAFNFDYSMWEAIFNNKQFNLDNSASIWLFAEDIDVDGYWEKIFDEFKIKSSLTVAENTDYYDIFGFSTRFSNSMYDFYMSHRDLIEGFMSCFKECSKDLIRSGEQNKIIFTNSDPEYLDLVDKLKNGLS